MEELLRFFHVRCADKLKHLEPKQRIKLMANIDVACIEAFVATRQLKQKPNAQAIQESLLEAAARFLKQLQLKKLPVDDCPWMNFDNAVKKVEPKSRPTQGGQQPSSTPDSSV